MSRICFPADFGKILLPRFVWIITPVPFITFFKLYEFSFLIISFIFSMISFSVKDTREPFKISSRKKVIPFFTEFEKV